MGLLKTLLFRPRAKVRTDYDRVWMSEDAKYVEVAHEAAFRARKGAAAILLVAHFDDVAERLAAISQNDIGVPVRLVRARDLNPSVAAEMDLESTSIAIICADRHPVFSLDAVVLDFAQALSCPCWLSHHLSFEDALLQRVVDAEVIRMFGVRESQCLQSRMITRRIRRTQRHVEASSATNITAVSAEEWFAQNCPDMRPAKH